jgi:hypothetical protein
MRFVCLFGPVCLLLALAACGGAASEPPRTAEQRVDEQNYPDREIARQYRYGSLTGEEGFTLMGNTPPRPARETAGMGVNAYLWRAALDTISFMPVAQTDPFGGAILTDWYAPPETPNERIKVNLFILGRALHADALRVSVFRQNRDGNGEWHDSPVDPETTIKLEDAILTRARQMKLAQDKNS